MSGGGEQDITSTYDSVIVPRRHSRLWLRLLRNLLPLLSVVYLLTLVVVCIAGPKLVTGYDPDETNYDVTYAKPSSDHWAGTDALGRDMAARLITGGRISLQIALAASIISLFVGVTWGSVAGYVGRRTDAVMMRMVDVLYGVPTILVVILLMVYLDQGIRNIYIAIGLTYWLNMARLTRAQVMSIKHREYVEAARGLGATGGRILIRHILPNTAGVVLVALTLFIPEAIFMEAFLSYIGLGVPAPDASWGSLAAEGARNLRAAPYLMLYPAAVICATMLAFNIAGDWIAQQVENQK